MPGRVTKRTCYESIDRDLDSCITDVSIHIDGRSHRAAETPRIKKGNSDYRSLGERCLAYVRWYLRFHQFVNGRTREVPESTSKSYELWEYDSESEPLEIKHFINSLHKWVEAYNRLPGDRYCLYFQFRYNNQSALIVYDTENHKLDEPLQVPSFYHVDEDDANDTFLRWITHIGNQDVADADRVDLPPPARDLFDDLAITRRNLTRTRRNLVIAHQNLANVEHELEETCQELTTTRTNLTLARNAYTETVGELNQTHQKLTTTRAALGRAHDTLFRVLNGINAMCTDRDASDHAPESESDPDEPVDRGNTQPDPVGTPITLEEVRAVLQRVTDDLQRVRAQLNHGRYHE